MHGGSFFLFFHPDDESSEKKTFAKNGYGTTVSYPTIRVFSQDIHPRLVIPTQGYIYEYECVAIAWVSETGVRKMASFKRDNFFTDSRPICHRT